MHLCHQPRGRDVSIRLLTFASWTAIVGCIGFALGLQSRGEPAREESGKPHERNICPELEKHAFVPGVTQSGEPDQASASPVEACIQTHHCDCPPPPPADLEDRYSETAVEAWIRELTAQCPGFADRELVVSCDEFPCLVGISIDEDDAMKRSPEVDATCGLAAEPDAPDLVVVANTSLNDDWYVVFAVRPRGMHDYVTREIGRARGLMGH